MFEQGTLSRKLGIAVLTGGLVAGTFSSSYASYKAFSTPGARAGQYVLGLILAGVGVMLFGFAAYFGNDLYKIISADMEKRRRARLSDTINF